MSTTATWTLCIAGAYLAGSIPFGVIIGRARGIDIREHGSRNVGASNVRRVLGNRLGLLCFVLDMLKGVVPVVAAGLATGAINRDPAPGGLTPTEMWLWMAVAAASIVGHMASIFLKFGGGKGVATSFGALVAMWPLLTFPALGAMVVWYGTLKFTRYISVASMFAAMSLPLWYLVRVIPNAGDVAARIAYASPPLIVTTFIAALVVWRHRDNIARLRRGEEPKSGEKPGVGEPDPQR